MGCTSAKVCDMRHILDVVTPEVPGDISLAGDMPKHEVAELANRYKGWLYLSDPADPHFFKDTIMATGCQLEVAPLPGSGPGIIETMSRLPRPLMLQCNSGNRAGAALLLWFCQTKGHNVAAANQLARDLKLKFFVDCAMCRPVREWVLSQLPGSFEGAAVPSVQPAGSPGYVVKQLFDPQGSSTFTYLIGCPQARDAALIDPVLGMQDRDMSAADALGLKVRYVLYTHCHADCATTGLAIKKLLPGVQTMISEASCADSDVKLRDGDEVKVGRCILKAIATPGHTDGCMTFTLQDAGEVEAAFTGDALLIRSCGRTDLRHGSKSKLYDSVHQRIFTLPGRAKIYPGHDYMGRNLSTVEEERHFNPLFKKSKDEFMTHLGKLSLRPPSLMDIAVPVQP